MTAAIITLRPILEAIGVGMIVFLLATPIADHHRRRRTYPVSWTSAPSDPVDLGEAFRAVGGASRVTGEERWGPCADELTASDAGPEEATGGD